jgi:hypothetical protein
MSQLSRSVDRDVTVLNRRGTTHAANPRQPTISHSTAVAGAGSGRKFYTSRARRVENG